MYKRDNQALIDKVSKFCAYIDHDNRRISAVLLGREYAATALHCVPDDFRQLNRQVCVRDHQHILHESHIYSINGPLDYIVFKRNEGFFTDHVPVIAFPKQLDKYIVVGFPFGEREPSFRVGHVSSVSTNFFFHGDSGGLPGFSGGGVFHSRSGALMGIARGSDWGKEATSQFGDVLQMLTAQIIISHIDLFARNIVNQSPQFNVPMQT